MLNRLLTTLLFFPSVTFNAIPSEIFPWAIVKSLFSYVRLGPFDIAVLVIFVVGTIVGSFFHGLVNSLGTLASYLNPLLIFIVLSRASSGHCRLISLLAEKVFFGLVLLGLMQSFGVLEPAQIIFDFLMPRGGVDVMGGGRGVSLLATEPSRAGVELVFIYALLVSVSDRVSVSVRGTMLQDLLLLLFLTTVIRSGTALGFGLVFIGFRRPVVILPILLVVGAVFSFLTIDSRALSLASALIQQRELIDVVRELTVQSGFRVISVVSAYVYAANHLVGYGVGAWVTEAVRSYSLAGYSVQDTNFFVYYHGGQFVSLKPTAYGALVALELGLLPFITISFYLWRKCRLLVSSGSLAEIALGLIFLLYVFAIGAVGNPVPWVCAALAIGLKKTTRTGEVQSA